MGNDTTRVAEIVAKRTDANNSADLLFKTMNAGSLGTRLTIADDGDVIVSTGNIKVIKSGSYITPSVVTPDAVVQDIASSGSRLQLLYRAGQGASKGSVVELGGVIDDSVSATSIFGVVAGYKIKCY